MFKRDKTVIGVKIVEHKEQDLIMHSELYTCIIIDWLLFCC